MNIFKELKKFSLPFFPIFDYKGREIYKKKKKKWGATAAPDYYIFSDRLQNISSTVRAKAFKSRYEKHEANSPDFRNIINDLCDNDIVLSEEIYGILNTAISIDKSIQDFRGKCAFYDGRIGISNDDIDMLVSGPVYYGQSYDRFIASSINFESEELNEIFLNEIILSFEDPIYFSEGTYEHLDIKNEDLDYLNKMKIYKSNTIDILKLPTDGYMPCVDVNNRFNNGDLIKTELAWIFEKHIHSRLSVVIII